MNKARAIENSVQQYLDSIGVKFGVHGGIETDHDGWLCDEWNTMFTRQGKPTLSNKFYTGVGHRKTIHRRVVKVKPTAATVLYSLLSDARLGENNLLDFCDELGCNPDSKKDSALYEACCKTNQDIRQFFSSVEREHLTELLEDY